MYTSVLKSQKYYNDNKKKFNKLYGFQMKKMVVPEYVGYCSYIFQEFMKQWKKDELPKVQDFADFYFSFTNPIIKEELYRPDSKYYGRSLSDFRRLAEQYKESCDDLSLSVEQCFDDLVNHIVVETFNGQIREIMLEREYESKGYKLEHTNGMWDHEFGVDFIVKDKDDVIKGYIQCKPISFFSPYVNQSCLYDRANVFHKEESKKKYCEENKLPYYQTKFIIYNNEYPDKWCSLNGRRSFLAKEMMDKEGKVTMNLKKFEYI